MATTKAKTDPCCGNKPTKRAVGALPRWPVGYRVKVRLYNLATRGVDTDALKARYVAACAAWSAACGITWQFVRAGARANLVPTFAALDGRGRTLADSELPGPEESPDRVLIQRYDTGEDWSTLGLDYFQTIALHEIGHALGIDHLPSGNIMAPIANPDVVRNLQPADVREAVLRYGPPATQTNQSSDVLECESLLIGGTRYRVVLQPL